MAGKLSVNTLLSLVDSSRLWSEGLIKPESLAQDFGFAGVLGKQAHSRLRNCFYSVIVERKDKLDSGIIEFLFLFFSP